MAATMLKSTESTYAIDNNEVSSIEKAERLDRCRPDIAAVAIVCAGCPMLRFCPKLEAEPATIESIDIAFEMGDEENGALLDSIFQDPFIKEGTLVNTIDSGYSDEASAPLVVAEVPRRLSYLERLLDDSIDVVVADSTRQIPIEMVIQEKQQPMKMPEDIIPIPILREEMPQEVQTEDDNIVITTIPSLEVFVAEDPIDEPELIVLTVVQEAPVPSIVVNPIDSEELSVITPKVLTALIVEPELVTPVIVRQQLPGLTRPDPTLEMQPCDDDSEPVEIDRGVETLSFPNFETTIFATPTLEYFPLEQNDNENFEEIYDELLTGLSIEPRPVTVQASPQRERVRMMNVVINELPVAPKGPNNLLQENPENRLVRTDVRYSEHTTLLQRVALSAMKQFVHQRQWRRIGI